MNIFFYASCVFAAPTFHLIKTLKGYFLWLFMITLRWTGPNNGNTGPDSANGRASASGAGGVGSIPGRAIPKALIMVPVATLLGAQHYKASTGSSLTHY